MENCERVTKRENQSENLNKMHLQWVWICNQSTNSCVYMHTQIGIVCKSYQQILHYNWILLKWKEEMENEELHAFVKQSLKTFQWFWVRFFFLYLFLTWSNCSFSSMFENHACQLSFHYKKNTHTHSLQQCSYNVFYHRYVRSYLTLPCPC